MVDEFDLGVDEITNRLVIPLIDDGKCYGLVRRATNSNQRPKYLTTKGFDNSKFLYGYDSLNMNEDYVVVTEGCIDTIVSRQLGLNSVAIMGTDLTEYKLKKLAYNFDKVMLMLDNDDAGNLAEERIAERLLVNGVDTYRINYEPVEDPGSLQTIDEVKEYVQYGLVTSAMFTT